MQGDAGRSTGTDPPQASRYRSLSLRGDNESGPRKCIKPGRYVERVRLEAARALLQDAQASIATVARLTGFGHPENLRRTFHKHLSVSPQEYAERFGLRPLKESRHA